MNSCRLAIKRSFVIRKWKCELMSNFKIPARSVCMHVCACEYLCENSDENLDSIELFTVAWQCQIGILPETNVYKWLLLLILCIFFFCTHCDHSREREKKNEHYYIAVKVNKFICTQHSIAFECFSVLFVIFTHWVLEWKKYGVCGDVCMHWCEEKPNWDNIVNRNVCLTRKIMCA